MFTEAVTDILLVYVYDGALIVKTHTKNETYIPLLIIYSLAIGDWQEILYRRQMSLKRQFF